MLLGRESKIPNSEEGCILDHGWAGGTRLTTYVCSLSHFCEDAPNACIRSEEEISDRGVAAKSSMAAVERYGKREGRWDKEMLELII